MKRREFVKNSVNAGIAAWTAVSADRVFGANERLRVGLIGCGGRGTFDARLMRGTPEDIQAVANENYHDGNLDPRLKEARNVEIAALCDVYESRITAAKRWAPAARTFSDFRGLLADKDIDAVIIATMDQWHAPMLILACEAGKDVYLEKPVMYRVAEAKAMIDAVRRNKRIVQIGTQHRSADHIAEAAKIVQGGKIGEVHFVRVWNFMSRMGSAPIPDSDPPADLNWDAWLGPAPKVPFNRARLNYRSFMDYTNGLISDYGNHRFDSVHQIMGVDTPLTVSSSGIRFDKERSGDILDLQQATYEYPNFVLALRGLRLQRPRTGRTHTRHALLRHAGIRGPPARHGFLRDRGGAFRGPYRNGTLPRECAAVDAAGAAVSLAPPAAPLERMHMNEDEPTPLHTKYFVDNVRSRKEPFANIEVGVRATTIACIGNVAYWTGRKLKWDAAKQNFSGDEEANRHLFRPYRKPWDLVKFG